MYIYVKCEVRERDFIYLYIQQYVPVCGTYEESQYVYIGVVGQIFKFRGDNLSKE